MSWSYWFSIFVKSSTQILDTFNIIFFGICICIFEQSKDWEIYYIENCKIIRGVS